MKTISKYRLKNKNFYISAFILTIIIALSWFIMTYLAQVLFYNNYATEADRAYAIKILVPEILKWENGVASAMYYMSYLFPVFPTFAALRFCSELKGYWSNAAIRTASIKKEIIKSCLVYAIQGGLVTGGVTAGLFTIAAPFLDPQIKNLGGFLDAFPDDFYFAHPYFVFLILALTVYAAFGFVFALLTCAIALHKKMYFWCLPYQS